MSKQYDLQVTGDIETGSIDLRIAFKAREFASRSGISLADATVLLSHSFDREWIKRGLAFWLDAALAAAMLDALRANDADE